MKETLVETKTRVLILGCGWVGEELALRLLEKGCSVWATTRTEEKSLRLSKLGVSVVHVDFNAPCEDLSLPTEVDFVLNSIPASSRDTEEEIIQRFNNVQLAMRNVAYDKQLFLSSVGIYPDIDGVFVESYSGPLTAKLALAEQLMAKMANVVVYRLGGLFGKDRVFAKYFVGRVCKTGNQLANFVHLEDVLLLIEKGFANSLTLDCYNIVAPEHPKKEEVVRASATKYGYALPVAFEPMDNLRKIVSGERITGELNYKFVYSTPLSF